MGFGTGLSFLFTVSLFLNIKYILEILRLYGYATASTDSAAYILGGIRIRTVAKFQNNKWLKIGDLKEEKFNLSAIFLNGEYLIVGGRRSQHINQHIRNRLVNSITI